MTLSLYIPRVSADITQIFISYIFERDYGKVNHIDLVSKMDSKGTPYNSAYIHFDYWYNNDMVNSLKKVIDCGNQTTQNAIVFYNDRNYWKVFKNNSKKVISGDRREKLQIAEKKEDEFPAPPLDPMLTNADFAKMCWAPKKTEVEYILEDEDEEFKSMCKTLFTEQEPGFDFVSADYAKALEQEIMFLRIELERTRNDVENLAKYSAEVERIQNLFLSAYNKKCNQEQSTEAASVRCSPVFGPSTSKETLRAWLMNSSSQSSVDL